MIYYCSGSGQGGEVYAIRGQCMWEADMKDLAWGGENCCCIQQDMLYTTTRYAKYFKFLKYSTTSDGKAFNFWSIPTTTKYLKFLKYSVPGSDRSGNGAAAEPSELFRPSFRRWKTISLNTYYTRFLMLPRHNILWYHWVQYNILLPFLPCLVTVCHQRTRRRFERIRRRLQAM